MKWKVLVGAGFVCVVVVAGMAQPMPPAGTPAMHHSACELGDSMAAKLGTKPMTTERAQQMCLQLMPTMRDADAAEFKRCCAAKLQGGTALPAR